MEAELDSATGSGEPTATSLILSTLTELIATTTSQFESLPSTSTSSIDALPTESGDVPNPRRHLSAVVSFVIGFAIMYVFSSYL